MLKELLECFDRTQDDIFAGRFKQADEGVVEAIELLAVAAESIPPARLPDFNKIMLNIIDAREKNDYLLLADLLEYKLKPFLTNAGKDKPR